MDRMSKEARTCVQVRMNTNMKMNPEAQAEARRNVANAGMYLTYLQMRKKRGQGRQKKKKKCASWGAAAPSPWIIDPRPCAEEGSVNDNDLREEEFFPSPQLEREVNEEGQEIGCFSLPEPENQVLHYPGYHFVLDLVLACRSFIANPSNENNAVLKIFQFLNSTDHGFTESQRAVMAFDSLENLAARCSQAEENIGMTHFIFMLNAIQLRCYQVRHPHFLFGII